MSLRLFEAFGVEIEYAIVDAETLDVRPVADRLIEEAAGEPASDLDRGAVAWSNELALHVLELKTNGPSAGLTTLPEHFQANVDEANGILRGSGARLLPGGMHPWMDPEAESRLWPHETNDVYRAFDRIFGCSGHGWTNLQSVHVNLPFTGDREFHTLHAAMRLVLPLTPAIAASSPIVDGAVGVELDQRLIAYARNSSRIPQVAGRIIPEAVDSAESYERVILEPIYEALGPYDPEGLLRHEWANARGAIARFDRGSIELRLLDTQECVTADVALVAGVVDAVAWLAERVDPGDADAIPTGDLADVLAATIAEGEQARLPAGRYRELLGVGRASTAGRAWGRLLDRGQRHCAHGPFADCLDRTLTKGPLARRLIAAAGPAPTRERLRDVYGRLCACLEGDVPFG